MEGRGFGLREGLAGTFDGEEKPEEVDVAETQAIQLAITVQSLLNQFSHKNVRADFCNGKFEGDYDANTLNQLDELRWILFPRWSGTSTHESNLGTAALKMKLLLSKDDNPCIIDPDSEDHRTYKEWCEILDAIACDKYWLEVPPNQRCVH